MSIMSEYLEASTGFDSNGLPSSTIQITFGHSPFVVAETENLSDLTTIQAVCQTDAVAEVKIIDNVVMLSLDFSNEVQTLAEFTKEYEAYQQQRDHVTKSLNELSNELALAQRNGDEEGAEKAEFQMRAMSIPFMIPALIPIAYNGTVQVSFGEDPKFVFFSADQLNQVPYKVIMIFEIESLFCQDELGIYNTTTEEEIQAQQEEMWYLQEEQRLEEEAYQSQYGYNVDYYDDNAFENDSRLKGIRLRK